MSTPASPSSWVAVLDGLEAALARAEASLVAGRVPEVEGWAPPSTVADLPGDLRPRAQALVARQERLARALDEVLRQTRDQSQRTTREQALAHHVRSATSTCPPPVYLDVLG